jgi:hypothetical protein
MPKGGRRPGAGRPTGRRESTFAARLRELRKKLLDDPDSITPLEIMHRAMIEAFQARGARGAFPYAKEVAVYLHPRLAATALASVGINALPPAFILEFVEPHRDNDSELLAPISVPVPLDVDEANGVGERG